MKHGATVRSVPPVAAETWLELPFGGGRRCRWRAEGAAACRLLEFLRSATGLPESGATVAEVRGCELFSGLPVPAGRINCRCRDLDASIDPESGLVRCFLTGEPDSPVRFGRAARMLFFFGLLPELLSGELLLGHGALAVREGRGVLFCGPSGIGKSTAVSRLPEDWEVLGDDCFLLSESGGSWFVQPAPTWSIWISGKPFRRFDCSHRVELGRVFLVERGPGKIAPLSYPAALSGWMPSFADMIRWHLPAGFDSLRRRLMSRAFERVAPLARRVPPELLQLTLEEGPRAVFKTETGRMFS